MDNITLLLIAVSLAMDAFAVSVTSAIVQNQMNKKQALIIAALFGLFQGIMPVIGYFLGSRFSSYISAFDHYVVFFVLAFVGGKMVFEAVHEKSSEKAAYDFNLKTYIVLAIITSIDALSVGLSFAFIDYPIAKAATIIALVTFIICAIGTYIGKKFGDIFHNKSEIIGGVMLILIGMKILLEGLGIL